MRLSKIKLAGFKSFVDPTTIPFPSSMTCIVGPNGCGKSNVIDAVRWVLGESSAKHLRGDSMADVIFNGSSSRQPVGHATIELVFDNSDGSLGGQYANYNEIAIRRVVSRDGQSIYYLNNTRCRRKDITDIFLGTGLGPRSYAIIEQGMISRFIDAKPEEMRMFLEEAAGISKYKERRRETENRIRHTRDNLDRLNDLRDEIGKQLQRLDRQAKVAEKYRHLKEEERLVKAQLLALRWRNADKDTSSQKSRIQECETTYEAQVAVQRKLEARIEALRQEHNEATEAMNGVQAESYEVGSNIARVEKDIQHTRERRQQLREDLQQLEQSLEAAQQNLTEDQSRITELEQVLAGIAPAMEEARESETASAARLAAAEEAMHDWQLDWDDFNQESADTSRIIEVEKARMEHLQNQLAQIRRRIDRLSGEEHAGEKHETEIRSLDSQAREADTTVKRLQDELEGLRRNITRQRGFIQELDERLNNSQSDLQEMRGRLASLEALQEHALGKLGDHVVEWLTANGLQNTRRLAEVIRVEPDWQHAAETVLGFYLEAVGVDALDDMAGLINTLDQGAVTVFDRSAAGLPGSGQQARTLDSVVQSEWDISSLIGSVYIVDTLDEAMSLRHRLGAGESVITRDGIWLGTNWLRVTRESDDKSGVLNREQEIKDLTEQYEMQQKHILKQQANLDEAREKLRQLEDSRDAKQAAITETSRLYAEVQAQLSANEASLQQIRNQAERAQADMKEMQRQIDQDEEELAAAKLRYEKAVSRNIEHEQRREVLHARRDELRERLEDARDEAREDHDKAHQLAIQAESSRTALDSTRQAMQRINEQITRQDKRRTEITAALQEDGTPVESMEKELEQLLAASLEVENRLKAARTGVEDIDRAIQQAGTERNEAEQKAQDLRTELEHARMEFQGMNVKRDSIKDQISETTYQLETLFEELPEEATEETWQEKVEKLDRRIQRLGPINLAAIDEFGEMTQRKEYLDAQHKDLTDAMSTLENAIRKIDKESKERFKDTFNRVNNKLQEMFPKLFGGGMAHLEMDTDDLLNSGVTLMARPPGKRISSIHLLSGGEKALTAVAMIFAIFELNPAPFCLLDEVDAPLDDNNVKRFSDLVAEMSERVQFIFISHNKLTMEIADHLTGVTMHEPGVSRIVAVDMDEAVAMAAS